MMIRAILLTAMIVLMGGCTSNWVKLEPGAERVLLVEAHEVTRCERLGQATTSVRERVAAYQRKPGRVEQELADLARNSAVELGGDTIVADGPVDDGQRRFLIYRCRM